MMRFDKFSERAQDAAARAAEIIQRYGHNQIDSEHILLACRTASGICDPIIEALSVVPGEIVDLLDEILRTTPKANIFGGPSGQVFLTPRVKMVVDMAKTEANRLGDEYISTEHLFLAILAEKNTQLARMLEEFGFNRQNVLAVIRNSEAERGPHGASLKVDIALWKSIPTI